MGVAIGTVTTALATGGAGIVALVTQGGRKTVSNITKGLVRNAAEKKARGEHDEAEEVMLQGSYNYLRNAKRAAVGGAFGAEYPQMAGAIGAEFDDAGRPIDGSVALLGLVGGIPLAGVGVAGENPVAEALIKTALKRAPKDAAQTSVLRQYASDVARGAGLGGVTELGTERNSRRCVSRLAG